MNTTDGPKPLIGISLGFHDFGDYLGVGFHRPIALAGGIPVTLPRLRESLDDVLNICDGLMLAGGHDIAPEHYHQAPHAKLGRTDPARDAFELELVRHALAREIPIIGTCRGMQVLNVALGGTLVQDVTLVPEWAGHPTDPSWTAWKEVERASLEDLPLPAHPRHAIAISRGSLLHGALGVESIEVNSFHHQAIDRVPPGVHVTARAPDGVVEAIECDGEFALAMQCELQEEWRVQRRFLAVFEKFVSAARNHRRRGPMQARAVPPAQARALTRAIDA